MVYIKLFQTEEEKQACTDTYEYLSYTIESDKVNIHEEVHDYSQDYLTFVALSDGTFKFSGNSNSINYSTDNGETWGISSNLTLNVQSGDKVLWKGYMTPRTDKGVGTFSGGTATFDAEGNPMSLLYADNFVGQTSLKNNYAFAYLFKSSNIANAHNLILPTTTLTEYCYQYMFQGCTSLTQAPSELPAPIATNFCYSRMFSNCTSLVISPKILATSMTVGSCFGMFSGCTSLTTAPQLPATTLNGSISNNGCYESMFNWCTNLTTAPELPATTLAYYCYRHMFSGCTNLNHITMLATDISANNCLNYWVKGVASTGTFVKAASMTTLPSGEHGIPYGWTVQDATE